MKQIHPFLWADIPGLFLSQEDKEILSHPFISGVVLFSRNYESLAQLQTLTHQIKSISSKLIITVDQEGGRVQRFRDEFTELPSMHSWGEKYVFATEKEKENVKNNFSKTISVMVSELKNAGIYSTLVPVLDIDYDRNKVIAHRSFGDNKKLVTELSQFMIAQCHQFKMPVTGKHFPGHGWVTVDSHLDLPIDERSFEVLSKRDITPFRKLSTELDAIMLAHIVYKHIDPQPVCFSPFWIQDILRAQLQFDGLIMSDDLSMQAVAKMCGYEERANRALEAGCDILLACNSRKGVVEILDFVRPRKNPEFSRRLKHYTRFL
ncbi:MAG: beta-N-acetylhexosaminidase [Gammaproteobacteria bacterium RIFCSPHIGHO2_12_FULL_38_11]|nr:MAG: beta-N-acetylhexosaminidase [Gammaproteobacteria bacterium RIFCSPHIGHO2_12_FULL_38_11]